MTRNTQIGPQILRDLGGALIMRRAKIEDRERVADFHANTLLDIGETGPLVRLHGFVLDLMSGQHPTFKPGDFTVVEDTKTGHIVSSMCLISQTWTYKGIPFPFGQPDIVSTDPAYRRRGLVRAQMEAIHRWSAERGELVQGITGIPWYYRQFGYELALNLDAGRAGSIHRLASMEEKLEPFRFREATTEDIPLIAEMYMQSTARSLVASVRNDSMWRYDIEGRHETSGIRAEFRVIENAEGQPAGVLVHSRKLENATIGVRMCEAAPGTAYLQIVPGVMRYLAATGAGYAKRDGGECETIAFYMGEKHPLYDTVPDLLTEVHKPYAWYIRVPDLPAFVRRIVPALENRLAESPQAGYTGEMRVSFYRDGLHFKFDTGSISVEVWKPDRVEEGDAAFPELTFLQLLFGCRSLEDLQYAFADCFANGTARVLLPILFPKEESRVWTGG